MIERISTPRESYADCCCCSIANFVPAARFSGGVRLVFVFDQGVAALSRNTVVAQQACGGSREGDGGHAMFVAACDASALANAVVRGSFQRDT
jgi:hypothetical protein